VHYTLPERRVTIGVVISLDKRGGSAKIRDRDPRYDKQVARFTGAKHWETEVAEQKIAFKCPSPRKPLWPLKGTTLVFEVLWSRELNTCRWGYPPTPIKRAV
jgi:hypothetical protein